MSENLTAFSYKPGNSFVHKMPTWIKLLSVPFISVLFFLLPFYFSLGLILIQTVLCFVLHFTIREQIKDLKVIFYYALILYFTSFIGNFCSEYFKQFSAEFTGEKLSLQACLKQSSIKVFLNQETAFMLIKLFCLMQSASIVFKTSTSLEIRNGVEVIESSIRKILPFSKKNKFTNIISMFINFIPMVFKIFNETKKTWKARGGKNNLKMYMVIFPVLFSVGMKKAYNHAKAVAIRTE